MGTQLPPKEAQPPQFSAHLCCGQMALWIKMPFGKEEGLVQGHLVLDRNERPPPKKKGA